MFKHGLVIKLYSHLLRFFNSSEHINENRDGPYHGFGYSSLISDPLILATWSQRKLNSKFETFKLVVNTKTSIIQMVPNILTVG